MSEIIIFDLEFTAWDGSWERWWDKPDEHREVVQIGAVKVEAGNLEEIDSISIFIKPKINPQLSEYFINLTGITQEVVDSKGIPFERALGEFYTFTGDNHVYSWGHDPEVLKENCGLYDCSFSFDPEQFFGAREIFKSQGIDVARYMSSTISEAFGVENPHRGHHALNDARSILLALTKLPKNPF